MIQPHICVRAFFLLGLAATTACSSQRIAGSMRLTNEAPAMLRVRGSEPADVSVQLWNRGPGEVHFQRVRPAGGELDQGVLEANGREFTWDTTTRHFELLLTTAAEEATVAYTLRSDQSIEIYVGRQLLP